MKTLYLLLIVFLLLGVLKGLNTNEQGIANQKQSQMKDNVKSTLPSWYFNGL